MEFGVVGGSDRYEAQWARTRAADLEYPIYLLKWRNDWTILDGVHRLLKADILKCATIKARRVPESSLPLIPRR